MLYIVFLQDHILNKLSLIISKVTSFLYYCAPKDTVDSILIKTY